MKPREPICSTLPDAARALNDRQCRALSLSALRIHPGPLEAQKPGWCHAEMPDGPRVKVYVTSWDQGKARYVSIFTKADAEKTVGLADSVKEYEKGTTCRIQWPRA